MENCLYKNLKTNKCEICLSGSHMNKENQCI